MRVLFFCVALFTLSGCQNGGIGRAESPAWYMTATQEHQLAYFSKRCASYGFQPGTNEMATCIMTESRSSRGQARASMDAASQSMATHAAASQRRTVTTNCNRFGNSVNCTSY